MRVAFGAGTGDLCALVLRKGVALAAAGVLVGLGAAGLIAPRAEALLFTVGAQDPLAFGGAALLLLASALAATLVPAVRGARVDPQGVLRGE